MFENSIVVASALVAELRYTRPVQNRVPTTGHAGSNPAGRTTRCPRPWRNWETRRIQAPVPVTGCAGSTPAGRTTRRVVGEIAYHSWLLPLSCRFESDATHHAPLAELG
jgi:hypothetical protein